MKTGNNEFFELETDYFNEDLMTFEDNADLDAVIEVKPKKPKMKYNFYIAS